MSRNKLKKYMELKDNSFVIEQNQELFFKLKGSRNKTFFKNNNSITLELACGKGEYTLGMAQKFPNKNFIGIDIKGDRIFIGANELKNMGLNNAGFVRMNIHDLKNIFNVGEIDDIRLIHPDPRPKNSDRNRRLTSPKFLTIYKDILKKGGTIKLKTDDIDLFKYSLEQFTLFGLQIISITFDLYKSALIKEHLGITTHYEKVFVEKGRKINYVVCKYI